MIKKVATTVREKIERGGSDKLWTYADFEPLPGMAVAAALSRMAKKGSLDRVRKGIYYKPRKTRFGLTAADPSRVAAAVLDRRGIAWKASGLPAYNALGLTTQVSPLTTFAVDRDVSSLRTSSDRRVRFRVVPKVKNMTDHERAILDALRDLRSIPDSSPEGVVNRIVELFRSNDFSFSRMIKLASAEPPRVRALLGTIGTIMGESAETLKPLKESLNVTTTFKLGLAEKIPAARSWGIR
jgi:hypothetical protein